MPATPGTTSQAVHREEWLDAGACRSEDPELFFPITSSGPSARQIAAAKEVCQGCGVQSQCLHYALESHQSYGVWGGTSEEERMRMTRRAENRSAYTPAAGARRPSRPDEVRTRGPQRGLPRLNPRVS